MFLLFVFMAIFGMAIFGIAICDYLNFGEREKPIIVTFEDGTFGIRKKLGKKYYYLNKNLWLHSPGYNSDNDINFWWSIACVENCKIGTYDAVIKRWKEKDLTAEDLKKKPDYGKPLSKLSKHIIKEFRGVDVCGWDGI